MVTAKQRAAARRNIKKAQAAWKRMSRRARAKAMPGGKGPIRKRPAYKRKRRRKRCSS